MFDLEGLGDIGKLAGKAREIQKKQEEYQKEQVSLLKKISHQLDEAISLLRKQQKG